MSGLSKNAYLISKVVALLDNLPEVTITLAELSNITTPADYEKGWNDGQALLVKQIKSIIGSKEDEA